MLTDFGDGLGPLLRDMWRDPFGRDLLYIVGVVLLLKALAALVGLTWFILAWRADEREFERKREETLR